MFPVSLHIRGVFFFFFSFSISDSSFLSGTSRNPATLMLPFSCSARGITIPRVYLLPRISEPTLSSPSCKRVCNIMNLSNLLTRYLFFPPRLSTRLSIGSSLIRAGGNSHFLYPRQLFLWSSLAGSVLSHASFDSYHSRRCVCAPCRCRPSSPAFRFALRCQIGLARLCRDQWPPNLRYHYHQHHHHHHHHWQR